MQIFNELGIHNIRGDLFDGISVAVIAVPMALAFAIATEAGLLTMPAA